MFLYATVEVSNNLVPSTASPLKASGGFPLCFQSLLIESSVANKNIKLRCSVLCDNKLSLSVNVIYK